MPNPPHFQLDALREMVNTGLGRAASSLNMMLYSPIELPVQLGGKDGGRPSREHAL